ncbi:MAG: PilZ domain-containing protein [Thermoanaerobaculales bacterium]
MEVSQRSTLVVGAEIEMFERLAPLLRSARFFADYVETGEAALESIKLLPFDAIVVTYPLPDILAQVFLDALRANDSPCRHSAVVVLAPPELRAEAEALVGRGANRVMELEDHLEHLPHVLLRLLEASPRFPIRAVSRLMIEVDNGMRLTLCQTENVSQSGMLIRTGPAYPVGTKVNFELALPGERKPVRGLGVVVRHTTPHWEKVTGVGVHFSSFEGDDKSRYEARLAQIAS